MRIYRPAPPPQRSGALAEESHISALAVALAIVLAVALALAMALAMVLAATYCC